MAKKKKLTKNQALYAKELKRIKGFMRRAEKRGYKFDEDVLPEKPSRITKKAIETLKNLTPEKLYAQSVYGGEVTNGEIVPGLEGLKAERKTRAEKAAKTRKEREKQKKKDHDKPTHDDTDFFDRIVLSNWYATLDTFRNGEAYGLLRTWLNNLIRANGMHNCAVMLQNAAENGILLTWETVYKGDAALMYIGYMYDFLPEQGIVYKEEELDRLQFMQRLGDALEQSEDWERPF